MFVQFTGTAYSDALDHSGSAAGTIAQSGLIETLVGFEGIGSRRSFARNEEIFGEWLGHSPEELAAFKAAGVIA